MADWYLPRKPRADGRWRAKYRRDRHDRWRYVYGRSLGEVKSRLQAVVADLEEGIADGTWTVGGWIDRWLARGAADWAQTTADNYAYRASLLPDWLCALPLRTVTAEQVELALDELGAGTTRTGRRRSPRTVADVRGLLLQVFRDAHGRRLIGWNPVEPTRPPRQTAGEPQPLRVDEAAMLIAVLDGHRLRSLWLTMLAVGLRLGEATWLRWSEVDLDAGTLTVVRTRSRTAAGRIQERDEVKTPRSRRTVLLPQLCVDALRERRQLDRLERIAAGPAWHPLDLVWPTTVGTAIEASNARRQLASLAAAAGIGRRVTPHLLRHSAASLLLAAGVPSRTIMDVLGHASDRMVGRYQHVHDSLRHDAAAAIDRLIGGQIGGQIGGPGAESGV